jgi:hypothetical protein
MVKLLQKNFFAVQPYLVGSRQSKSIAITIPSALVKLHNIDRSTIFILKENAEKNRFDLEIINQNSKGKIHAKESFEASSQHVSKEIH